MTTPLHRGDCIDVLKTIEDNSIDLTITSPPYYNTRDYSHWDTYQEYLDFMDNSIRLISTVTKPGRFFCLNSSPVIEPRKSRQHESIRIPIPFHLFNICEKIGWTFIDELIWLKPEGSSKNRNGGFFQHRKPCGYKPNVVTENILVFRKPGGGLIDKITRSYSGDLLKQSLVEDGYERSNVWKINPETKSKHSGPFPVELPHKLVSYYSYVGDLVLDPFMGSGTTGVSCKKLNRSFIGIEKDDRYFEMSYQRINNKTN